MLVKTLSKAMPYDAPNHFLIRSVRLLGFEEGGPTSFWVGHSTVDPGGCAGPDASSIEKVYVVLSGSLEVTAGDATTILGPMNACRIPPHETRKFINLTDSPVRLLVIMPYPP